MHINARAALQRYGGRMKHLRFDSQTDRARVAIGLAFALAGAVSLWLLMAPIGRFGRICGHAPGGLHCPACYAAAAVIVAGLAFGLIAPPHPSALRRSPPRVRG
jgi:hypothetical protein